MHRCKSTLNSRELSTKQVVRWFMETTITIVVVVITEQPTAGVGKITSYSHIIALHGFLLFVFLRAFINKENIRKTMKKQ